MKKVVAVFVFFIFLISFSNQLIAKEYFNQTSLREATVDVPLITSITPDHTPKGQTPIKITIKGKKLFKKKSKVFFNQTEVPSIINLKDKKIVLKNLSPELFKEDRTFEVKVVNPQGISSNVVKFIVGTGLEPASILINEPASFVVNIRESIGLKATVLDKDNKPIPNAVITFESNNPEKAIVDNNGLVTGVTQGAATIKLSFGSITRHIVFAVNKISSFESGIFNDGGILAVSDVEPSDSNIVLNQSGGSLIFASDFTKHVLKSRTLGQALTVFAGKSGELGNTNGTGTTARFNGPLGITAQDQSGILRNKLYLADANNQSIRRVNISNSQVETFITASDVKAAFPSVTSWGPRDVAVDTNRDVYITDAVNHVIWHISPTTPLTISVLAGNIGQTGSQDGTGALARFSSPQDLTLVGNILNVTEGSKSIRLVALPSGTVSTISSSSNPIAPLQKYLGIPQAISINNPKSIAADRNGTLYIADGDNVRVLTRNGQNFSITNLVPAGTFKDVVSVSVIDNTVLALDGGAGTVVQIDLGPPTITKTVPSEAEINTTPEIVITGTNFLPETQVKVGNQLLTDVIVNSSEELKFKLPSQSFGGVLPVVVQNRGGSVETKITINGATAAPSIILSAFPSERMIQVGQDAIYTINIDRVNFPGEVNLTFSSDLPSDVIPTFTPNSVKGNQSVLELCTCKAKTLPPGKYSIQIGATIIGGGVKTVDLTLIVVGPTPMVSLSATPEVQTIVQGQSALYQIKLGRVNFAKNVNFSLTGLPSEASATFDPNPTAETDSVLTVKTTSNIIPGKYPITIAATTSDIVITPVTVTLVVNKLSREVVISSSTPSQTIVAGQSAKYSINISRTNFPDAVSLQLIGDIPSGVSLKFEPNSTIENLSTLVIQTSTDIAVGSYSLKVGATAQGVTITPITLTLIVNDISFVELSTPFVTQTVTAGDVATYQINIKRTNFPNQISFSISGLPRGITAQFNQNPTADESSILTITTPATISEGEFQFTIRGTASQITIAPIVINLRIIAKSSIVLITATPSQDVEQGKQVSYEIEIVRKNFNDTVNLSIISNEVANKVFGASLRPFETLGNNSILTINASTLTPVKTYSLQIEGTASGVEIKPLDIFLNVIPPQPKIDLLINPAFQSIKTGGRAMYGVTANAVNFSGSVNLNISGNVPPKAKFTFNPSLCTKFPCTSTLTFSLDPNTPPATYNMKLTGTAAGVSINPIPFTLQVN